MIFKDLTEGKKTTRYITSLCSSVNREIDKVKQVSLHFFLSCMPDIGAVVSNLMDMIMQQGQVTMTIKVYNFNN